MREEVEPGIIEEDVEIPPELSTVHDLGVSGKKSWEKAEEEPEPDSDEIEMDEVISAVEVKVSSEDQPVEPDAPDTEELQSEESSEPTEHEAGNTAEIIDQAVKTDSEDRFPNPRSWMLWALGIFMLVMLFQLGKTARTTQAKKVDYTTLQGWITSGEEVIEGHIEYPPPNSSAPCTITGIRVENGKRIPFSFEDKLIEDREKFLIEIAGFQSRDKNTLLMGFIVNLLPILIIFVLIWFVLIRQIRSAGRGAMNFGKSKARMLNKPRKPGRRIMPWAAVLVLGAVVGLGYWMSNGPVDETKPAGSTEVAEKSKPDTGKAEEPTEQRPTEVVERSEPEPEAPVPTQSASTLAMVANPTIAYVTNGIDPFWDLCAGGVREAEAEFGVKCEIHMPARGLTDQKSIMETLLAKGIKGMAVSPIDAENQTPFLNDAAKWTVLITHDADAPKSDRLLYIGTDNYKAGRALGQLVKAAIPDGGEVMIFVGRLEQLNARQRRQGVIDELLERPHQTLGQVKFDEVAKVFKGDKYTVLDTRTDNFVMDTAKSNAEDAITKHPKLACMVGLFAYNPPRCLQAIKEAGKVGQIKVCGFDEADELLQAIKDGNAHGTISQQPWKYGYHSVRVLKSLIDGDTSVIPENKFIDVGYRVITKENIDEFWAEKKKMADLGTGKYQHSESQLRRPRTVAEAKQLAMIQGEKKKQDGGVRKRATIAGFDAKASPFGDYDARLIAAIQTRWNQILDQYYIPSVGEVVLTFNLWADGKVTNVQVERSTVNTILALKCERAVTERAPYAPWPEKMHNEIGIDRRFVRFTFYYN